MPSISTSAPSTSTSTASTAPGFFRSMATLGRPRVSRSVSRGLALPAPAGRSSRITSAPRSASSIAACGPGPMPASSTTRIPRNGPVPCPSAYAMPAILTPALSGSSGLSGVWRSVVLVHHGVTLASTDHRAIHRHGDHERHHEREQERAPEEEVEQSGIQSAGNNEDDKVVDDLHHEDRHGVGSQRDCGRRTQAHARAQHRRPGERVAEPERQDHRQRDARAVRPPPPGRQDHPEDLTDRTSGEAVEGRRHRHAPAGVSSVLHVIHGGDYTPGGYLWQKRQACASPRSSCARWLSGSIWNVTWSTAKCAATHALNSSRSEPTPRSSRQASLTVTCADSTGIPLVIVHACRSCTSSTPGTSPRCERTSSRSRCAGVVSSSTLTASRSSANALGRISTAMTNDAKGSARRKPVPAITTAATTTSAEPSRSPSTSR